MRDPADRTMAFERFFSTCLLPINIKDVSERQRGEGQLPLAGDGAFDQL